MRRRAFVWAVGAGILGGVGASVADAPLYRVTDFATTAAKTAPEHRYALVITDVARGDEIEETAVVARPSTIEDSAVRELVERAVEGPGHRFDDLPDGLVETVARHDYFLRDGEGPDEYVTLALYRLHPDREPALSFAARVLDDAVAPGNPALVELAATNRSDRVRTLRSNGPVPFGRPSATAVGGDRRVTLWPPAAGPVAHLVPVPTSLAAVVALTPVEPGETRRGRFQLRASDPRLRPGRYVADGVLYSTPGRGGSDHPVEALSWELRFALEGPG